MGCKIIKTTVNREITEEEFVRLKGSAPFKKMRQLSKSLNFLMIFGGSSKLFSENALETSWSEEQVDDYIKTNNLYERKEQLSNIYKKADKKQLKYITVADHIRGNFFKAYPGLLARIDRERAFARKHGYIRSRFGHTRKAIEEMLRGSYDEKNFSKYLRNLDNICANTEIQNLEACAGKPAMCNVVKWLEDNHYKSFIFNEIHDSIDCCIYKPELKEVLTQLKHQCERYIPELDNGTNVKLRVDCEISDINKGQYYKGGHSPEEYGIDWNSL